MTGPIKKLDLYVLKKFLLLFLGAFCICLFVLMMQAMWRYIDELIGKGLTIDILARFFWYMGITLVPMSLPLSILLTALISFGNMGESLELTAMKSAGISLLRIMRPCIILSIILGCVSFLFQNRISPEAQKQLTRMLATMKETSPAIEIPEGVFYNGIPNVNLYVQKKNAKTGMLYDLIIYKMDQGFENAQIVLADSGKLETTADKHFLQLTIFDGEQFENLRATASQFNAGIHVPYDRETFHTKRILIDFDTDFNMMDENMFSSMARVKNLQELDHGADSIRNSCDSIGTAFYAGLNARFYRLHVNKDDSISAGKVARKSQGTRIRNIYSLLPISQKLQVIQDVYRETSTIKEDLEWQRPISQGGYTNMRKHLIEWHQKFALSLACMLFLFIGAPLGAIIRKGGLGVPTVISVIIFIAYYIINTSGMKLAKDDALSVWTGMWISTMVLAPFGFFLSTKANKDSSIFNPDNYLTVFRRFLGIHTKRHYNRKDVVIIQPRYRIIIEELDNIAQECSSYISRHHLPQAPNYVSLFFRKQEEDEVQSIANRLDLLLEELSNTQNPKILTYMNLYPDFFIFEHLSPARHYHGINIALGLLFPIGILIAWRVWKFRIILYKDMIAIATTNSTIREELEKEASLVESQLNNP